MSDITLTASARSALTSLQGTGSLMSRTQGRLTSGLKVASAIDDAVAYFKAKGLSDRASDFTDRKTEIDQGISSLKTSVNGTAVSDNILKQMKGLINSARTADNRTRATLTSQFNDLARQLNSAQTDASYQGLNLINNSSASMTVYFNQGTSASLQVQAQNLQVSAIFSDLADAAIAYGWVFGTSSGTLSNLLQLGGASFAAQDSNGAWVSGRTTMEMGFSVLSDSTSEAMVLDAVSHQVDSAISNIRAASARLGGNVTFLQTRLDFTNNYVGTMTEGSGKLTLADLNEEGANLVALQTRQQIGIQSLSIAGQQQQAILSLLR